MKNTQSIYRQGLTVIINLYFQELQYAQRYHEPQGGGESSYSEPEEQRPQSILKNKVRIRECKHTILQ